MNAPSRRLLLFPGALGDFLLLAPAIAALRARGDAVEVSVRRALSDVAQAVVERAPGPPIDGAPMASLFTSALHPNAAAWLRGATRVDLWMAAAVALERDAAALAIGDVRRHSVERGDDGPHAADAYAAALGVAPVEPAFSPAWLDAAVEPRPRGVVLHPGAGAPAKRWSQDGFLHVAAAWRAGGGDVTILLGPVEAADEPIWRAAGHDVVVTPELRTAAALIASAPRYVGNDSGISHLAGLLGRRGAVLFGPTSPARWRPRGGALIPIVFRAANDADVAARVLDVLRSTVRV